MGIHLQSSSDYFRVLTDPIYVLYILPPPPPQHPVSVFQSLHVTVRVIRVCARRSPMATHSSTSRSTSTFKFSQAWVNSRLGQNCKTVNAQMKTRVLTRPCYVYVRLGVHRVLDLATGTGTGLQSEPDSNKFRGLGTATCR